MCSLYDLRNDPAVLRAYFDLQRWGVSAGDLMVRPTDTAPVIRLAEDGREAVPARWGLIPSWAKDADIARHTFNARAETVAEKPSFRNAFKRRRCIVPASGFYEWRAVPGERKKQRLRFTRPDGSPLALAGLWECWRQPGTGEALETFTIITTAANAFMVPIHARMPLLLAPGDWGTWLAPDVDNPALLRSMLDPCPNDWLSMAEGGA